MRPLSFLPPVIFNHGNDHLPQRIAISRGDISLLILCENRQNKCWQAHTAKQIDNSSTAALATCAESEADLANASAAGNDNATNRVSSQTIHDGFSFVR